MFVALTPEDVAPTTLDAVALEIFDSFICIGSLVINATQGENEIESCIGGVRAAFIRLQAFLWSYR